MVEASFFLISTKNRLLRNSVKRYKRIHDAYLDIMSEITKRMDTRDENSDVRNSTLSTARMTSIRDPRMQSRPRIHNQTAKSNILLLIKINSQPLVLCNILPTKIFRYYSACTDNIQRSSVYPPPQVALCVETEQTH
jgi:hypothetical protein